MMIIALTCVSAPKGFSNQHLRTLLVGFRPFPLTSLIKNVCMYAIYLTCLSVVDDVLATFISRIEPAVALKIQTRHLILSVVTQILNK